VTEYKHYSYDELLPLAMINLSNMLGCSLREAVVDENAIAFLSVTPQVIIDLCCNIRVSRYPNVDMEIMIITLTHHTGM